MTKSIFTTIDKWGDTLTIDQFVMASGRKRVMARILDANGYLQAGVELHSSALVALYGVLHQQLPDLVTDG